jgi:hypothetical protein
MLQRWIYFQYDPELEKRKKLLRQRWLKYYEAWVGSSRKRDEIIRKKVRQGKVPAL